MQNVPAEGKAAPALLFSALTLAAVLPLSALIAGREISRLYALAWSLFAAGTAFGITYTGRISLFRRLFFSASALSFLFHFKSQLLPGGPAPSCFSAAPYCHISMAAYFPGYLYQQYLALMSGHWRMWGPLTLAAAWLFVTLAIGRAWCSWACFYGGIDDGLSALPRRPLVRIGGWALRLRDMPAALLVFLMLASLAYMLPVFCLWLCPFKLTPAFADAAGPARAAQLSLTAAAAAALVIGPLLTRKRLFCSYLCPFGAWQAFWGRVNPFRVTVDKAACSGCGACAEACPSCAMKPGEDGRPEPGPYCNLCAQCLSACPKGALRYTLMGMDLPAVPRRFGRLIDARHVYVFASLTLGAVFSSLWAPAALRDLKVLISG